MLKKKLKPEPLVVGLAVEPLPDHRCISNFVGVCLTCGKKMKGGNPQSKQSDGQGKGKVKCETCGGEKYLDAEHGAKYGTRKCPTCRGTGVVPAERER
jgi:DNA-directed RNA polymerase subunit RPC12/RpoP